MEKTKKAKVMKKKNPKLLIAATACGAVAVVAGSAWGLARLQRSRVIHATSAYLEKGFAALAVEEEVDPHRFSLTRTQEGCAVALNAYYQAHRAERLEWAAQACLSAGIETPEAVMGLAASRELTGRDNEALQILGQSLAKFEKSGDIYYRMALIFRRGKRDGEATAAYLKAAELAGSNAQVTLEAMQYFMESQKWDLAKQMANRLKSVETDNPEVKLVIARAFQRAGDKGSAQGLIEQAKALLGKKPEQLQKAIEQTYSDVLNGGVMANAGAAGLPPAANRSVASDGKAEVPPVPPAHAPQGPQTGPDANRSVASDGRPVSPPAAMLHQGPPAGEPNGAHPDRTF